MENTPKKTRRALSVEEKRIMIDLKEQGYTNKYICDKFGRAKSIISDVLRNQKEKVLENNNLKQLRSKPVMDSRYSRNSIIMDTISEVNVTFM